MKKQLLLLLMMPLMVIAQNPEENAGRLKQLGMENISFRSLTSNTHILSFENRRYRFDAHGLAEVLQHAQLQGDTIYIVMQRRNIPMATAVLVHQEPVRVNWDFHHYAGLPAGENKSFGKIDIPVGLDYSYQIGNYDNPFRIALNPTIGTDMTISRGLSLQGAIALPVYNNLDDKTRIRPHHLVMVKDMRLPGDLLMSTSAGFFTRNRAGGHLQWKKYIREGIFSFGMNLGYTAFSRFTGPVKFIEKEDSPFAFYTVDADVRWTKYDLQASLSAGRFLYQDTGVMFHLFRQFGEKQIGLQLLFSDSGKNGGFFVRWPFLASRYGKPAKIRVRTARIIPLDYRYRGNDRVCRTYFTGETIISQMYNFFPSTITKQLP